MPKFSDNSHKKVLINQFSFNVECMNYNNNTLQYVAALHLKTSPLNMLFVTFD